MMGVPEDKKLTTRRLQHDKKTEWVILKDNKEMHT